MITDKDDLKAHERNEYHIYKNRDHMISKYWSLQLSQEKIDLNSKLWYYGSEIIFDIYIQ